MLGYFPYIVGGILAALYIFERGDKNENFHNKRDDSNHSGSGGQQLPDDSTHHGERSVTHGRDSNSKSIDTTQSDYVRCGICNNRRSKHDSACEYCQTEVKEKNQNAKFSSNNKNGSYNNGRYVCT